MRTKQLATLGVTLLLVSVLFGDDLPKDQVQQKIDDQITAWWPKPTEKQFDQIGWVPDIRTAIRLAGEHNRPVFLFTMDGRVNLGRC